MKRVKRKENEKKNSNDLLNKIKVAIIKPHEHLNKDQVYGTGI